MKNKLMIAVPVIIFIGVVALVISVIHESNEKWAALEEEMRYWKPYQHELDGVTQDGVAVRYVVSIKGILPIDRKAKLYREFSTIVSMTALNDKSPIYFNMIIEGHLETQGFVVEHAYRKTHDVVCGKEGCVRVEIKL